MLFSHGWEVFWDYPVVGISVGVFVLTVSEEIRCCGCIANVMESPQILSTIEFILATLEP